MGSQYQEILASPRSFYLPPSALAYPLLVAYSLGSHSKHASDQSKVCIISRLNWTTPIPTPAPVPWAMPLKRTPMRSSPSRRHSVPSPDRRAYWSWSGERSRAMEFFSTSAAYAKFHDKIIGSHARYDWRRIKTESSEGSSHEVFESFIEGLQELAPDIHEGVGRGLDLRLESKNLTGSALCVEDVIVHSSISIR